MTSIDKALAQAERDLAGCVAEGFALVEMLAREDGDAAILARGVLRRLLDSLDEVDHLRHKRRAAARGKPALLAVAAGGAA